MKKKRSIIIAITLTFAFAVSAETSQAGEKSKTKLFKTLDVNNDGKLTEKEFVITGLHQVFKSYDLNKNGKVDKEEFMKVTSTHKINASAEWEAMSRGSNEVTFKQSLRNKVAVKEMQSHFKDLDKKGKGYVTLNDLK